jgi:uncharacterized protein (DUF58 family)
VPARTDLFNEDFLRRLEHLRFATRRPVSGHLRGVHRSRRTGSGMVFSDYRPYTPGDDTRNLDWGIYLRLDRLILRLFEEEADLPVYLFVDASASMGFGEPSKFDFARRVAAAFAYLALLDHDRVSVVAWADGIAHELPVRRGTAQSWPVFRFLQGLAPAGGTSLQVALRSYFGGRRPRGLVVLLSDFLDADGFVPAANFLRQFRHEVFAMQVLAPQEVRPELPEDVVLVDAETGAADTVHVTPALIAAYREAQDAHCREIEAVCRRGGWTYLRARTDAPFEELML